MRASVGPGERAETEAGAGLRERHRLPKQINHAPGFFLERVRDHCDRHTGGRWAGPALGREPAREYRCSAPVGLFDATVRSIARRVFNLKSPSFLLV